MIGILILGHGCKEAELKNELENRGYKVWLERHKISITNNEKPGVIIKIMDKLTVDCKNTLDAFRRSNFHLIPLIVISTAEHHQEVEKYLLHFDLNFQIINNPDEAPGLIQHILSGEKQYRVQELSSQDLIAKNISERIKSIEKLCLKLTDLVKLNTDMIIEHKPQALMRLFCIGARKIIGAKIAIIALLSEDNNHLDLYLDCKTIKTSEVRKVTNIFKSFHEATLLQSNEIPFGPEIFNLPSGHPFESAIIVPLKSQKFDYGYTLFINKVDNNMFVQDDLYLSQSLGVHFTLINENLALTSLLEHQKQSLELEIKQRKSLQQQLESQYEVAKILAESPNIIAATPEILKSVCSKLGLAMGNLWVIDSERNTLRCANTWSIDHGEIKKFEKKIQDVSLNKGKGIPGRVWKTKESITASLVKDIKNTYLLTTAKKMGLQSVVAFPISFKDELMGVLEFLSFDDIASNSELHKIFTAICNQIATFIKRKRAEKELIYLVEHDPLTRLANRHLLVYFLNNALIRAKHLRNRVAVIFLDLDNFKDINDTLGHLIGDKLLKKVANRIKSCLRSADLIARVGGDEFVIVIHNIIFSESVAVVAQKILNELTDPFIIDGHECYISASIGISLYPNDGKDESSLLKSADLALYRAKESGRNNYQFCTNEMTRSVQARMSMENNLRRACKNKNEFYLTFQPVLDIKTQELKSIEALMRWQLPSGDMLYPIDFLSTAEETGLILPITEWVVREACYANRILQKENHLHVPISINISLKVFLKINFCSMISQILDETRMQPEFLQLELTESIITKDLKSSFMTIKSLRELGVKTAVDDLGIGFSNFNCFKAMAVEIIKIQKSSIRNIIENESDLAIVATIISLAHKLGMLVVAKGVEKERQLELLRQNHCDQYQGFLCCQPKSLKDFQKFLNTNWKLAA